MPVLKSCLAISSKLKYSKIATQVVKKFEKPTIAIPPPEQNYQLSRIKSGLIICSLENNFPVTNVGFIVKAGSRYESISEGNIGLTHLMRIVASLATNKCTQFGLSRNLDHLGASISVNTTRDYAMYNLTCRRDTLETAIKFFSYLATQPAFKHWEIKENVDRLKFDRNMIRHNDEIAVIEDVHHAVFRNGLANSLYCPKFMMGKHTCAQLRDFYHEHYTLANSALCATGIDHQTLANFAYKYFSGLPENSAKSLTQKASLDESIKHENIQSRTNAKIFFGGESRKHKDSDITCAMLVSEGASLKNSKEVLALSILQHILGVGPHIKYGALQTSGRLAKACTHNSMPKLDPYITPFSVACYNANYMDTGLFGVHIVSPSPYVTILLRNVVSCFRDLSSSTKNSITSKELEMAKTKLKVSLALGLDQDGEMRLQQAMLQTIVNHRVDPLSHTVQAIDSITMEDINRVAKKLMSSKVGLALRGNLSNAPYLDEIMNG